MFLGGVVGDAGFPQPPFLVCFPCTCLGLVRPIRATARVSPLTLLTLPHPGLSSALQGCGHRLVAAPRMLLSVQVPWLGPGALLCVLVAFRPLRLQDLSLSLAELVELRSAGHQQRVTRVHQVLWPMEGDSGPSS